jgi:hypothetical protein
MPRSVPHCSPGVSWIVSGHGVSVSSGTSAMGLGDVPNHANCAKRISLVLVVLGLIILTNLVKFKG